MPRKKTDTPTAPAKPAPRSRSPRTTTPKLSKGLPSKRASARKPLSSDAPAPAISYDQIPEAAYLRYVSRGGTDGSDFDDWLEAERELLERRQGQETEERG